MSQRMSNTPRRAGFTLVELLMAMVVGGLLTTGILSLLFSQTQFYASNDAAIEAQRSVRTAIDLMSRELRLASSEDLVAATADSVSIRFDILRASVCDSTGTDGATVFAYDSMPGSALGGSFLGTAFTQPYDSAWVYADGWLPTSSTGSGPKATCTAVGAPATGTANTYAETTGWTGGFAAAPEPGSIVRVYTRLTYRWAPAVNFGTGTALWRDFAELLAPFGNTAAFAYVMDDGSVQSNVSSGDLDEVRAIRISATAIGDGGRTDVDRSLEFDIPLRN